MFFKLTFFCFYLQFRIQALNLFVHSFVVNSFPCPRTLLLLFSLFFFLCSSGVFTGCSFATYPTPFFSFYSCFRFVSFFIFFLEKDNYTPTLVIRDITLCKRLKKDQLHGCIVCNLTLYFCKNLWLEPMTTYHKASCFTWQMKSFLFFKLFISHNKCLIGPIKLITNSAVK